VLQISNPKSFFMSAPRINWINEQDATGELAELYRKLGRQPEAERERKLFQTLREKERPQLQ
jgi:hypothetical protein